VPSLRFILWTRPLGLERPSVTLAAYFHCFRRVVCVELFLKKRIHLHGIVLVIAQGNLLHSVTDKFIWTYHLSINAAYEATKLFTIPSNRLWHTSGNGWQDLIEQSSAQRDKICRQCTVQTTGDRKLKDSHMVRSGLSCGCRSHTARRLER